MSLRTILVADDSSVVAETLDSLFGPLGCRVVYTPNGRAALTVVRAARPDLVIADVMLRVLTGIEFVRELRRDADLGGTPVILWSAVYQAHQINGFAKGCEPFTAWNKFDHLDGLVSVVHNLLGPCKVPQPNVTPYSMQGR
jgi:CheY-like chemotaxis protein